jgi:predicted RNase H-like nuclease (RuvC/YqgF family)
MEIPESFEKLEKSIAQSQQVVAELISEADKWKRMYMELAGQLESGNPDSVIIEKPDNAECEKLKTENRLLKAKLQQVIHRTENVRNQIGELLNS